MSGPHLITPGGNPACPKCGNWRGPGELHECPREPTPDQSYCDVGRHQQCSGYTEDESDPETCMCSCHDAAALP